MKCPACHKDLISINYWYSVRTLFLDYRYYCCMKCMWHDTHEYDRTDNEFKY